MQQHKRENKNYAYLPVVEQLGARQPRMSGLGDRYHGVHPAVPNGVALGGGPGGLLRLDGRAVAVRVNEDGDGLRAIESVAPPPSRRGDVHVRIIQW
jgi:hypothetical protein